MRRFEDLSPTPFLLTSGNPTSERGLYMCKLGARAQCGLRKPLPTFLGVSPTFPEFGRNFPVWGIFETSELSGKILLISLKKTLCTIFWGIFRSPSGTSSSANYFLGFRVQVSAAQPVVVDVRGCRSRAVEGRVPCGGFDPMGP